MELDFYYVLLIFLVNGHEQVFRKTKEVLQLRMDFHFR